MFIISSIQMNSIKLNLSLLSIMVSKDKNNPRIFNILTLILIIANVIVFLFLFRSEFEIILVFLGLFVICIKVFLNDVLTDIHKKQLSIFIIEYLIFFLLIISQKIINILNILD